ncbi:MAG TPA: ProQ/FINO family protein [Methylocystis sp.]|jgi:sRNA-binding protein
MTYSIIEARRLALGVVRRLWPKSLGAFVPLKGTIHADMAAELPGHDAGLAAVLAIHTNSTRYLRSVAAEGSQRHDLNGEPVAPVSPACREQAAVELAVREKRRTNNVS